jgi:hypothetical protein
MRNDLSPPPPHLERFPSFELAAGARLWLVHDEGGFPWRCTNDGGGRFDLAAPWGTCHFAEEPLGALIESCCRTSPEVDEQAIASHRLSLLTTEAPLRLADCTSPLAFGWGLTAEIHSIPDYTGTQRWARAFHAAGFDGIRYLLRHDPSRSLAGVARFGREGVQEDWAEPETRRLDAALLTEAAQRLGVHVPPSYREASTSAAARSPDSTAPSM